MESKTKHRILAVLVIIGLIIILLPFFQSGKETNDTMIVQAPPFPDPTIQAENTPSQSNEVIPNDTIVNNISPLQNPESTTAAAPPTPDLNDLNAVNRPSIVEAQPPQQTLSSAKAEDPVQEVASEAAVTAENSVDNNVAAQANQSTVISNEAKEDHLQSAAQSSGKNEKIKSVKSLSVSTLNSNDENGLINLKTQAYVIQIGSFKDKGNAIRLVNQLRSKGYRAFIQQVSTALGDSTRVFIGPEIKRTTARSIAAQLEKDMHIQGIVISYKPLTL